MTAFKTIRMFVIMALVAATASTGAFAQTRDQEAIAAHLKQSLRDAQSTLKKVEEVVTTSKARLDREWARVDRIERELAKGRDLRDAFQELIIVNAQVQEIEDAVKEASSRLQAVQETLKFIMVTARAYNLPEIYAAAEKALTFSRDLAQQADSVLNSSYQLKRAIRSITERY